MKNTMTGISSAIAAALLMSSSALANSKISETKADNSKMNQRDRDAGELTAEQQSTGRTDTEITRQIRRDLLGDRKLSVYAKNIKIITVDGQVTLKGPVRTALEERTLVRRAALVAGRDKVVDELEVSSKTE